MFTFSRSTFEKIRRFWSDKGPGGDCFWWLDLIALLGGNKSSFTSHWKKGYVIRYFSNFVFIHQGFIFTLQVKHSLHHRPDDIAIFVFELLKLFIFSVAASKMFMHALFQESFLVIKNFIVTNSVNSGDEEIDELEQRKFNQFARTAMRLSVGLMVVNVIAFSIPNSITEKALGVPPQLQGFGSRMTAILHCLAVTFMPFGIIPRFLTNFNTVATVLLGMRAKLRMLTYRYSQILVQPILREDLAIKLMTREIRTVLDHQLKYWRYFGFKPHLNISDINWNAIGFMTTHDRFQSILKQTVGKIFFLIHYSSLCSIGAFLFIAQHTGFNTFAASLASGATFFLLEYYILCNLVDTFKNEADAIGDVIYELCSKLPHSPERHSEYVQLRSSLMIIWMNAKCGVTMDCYGIFEISTLAFVGLANTAYTVLTFLISMG